MKKKVVPSKAVANKSSSRKSQPVKSPAKQPQALIPAKSDYTSVLTNLTQLIADSRRRAAATVNRELVCLYWQIGQVIVEQQESAKWGDAVVEQLSADLRTEFPDMKGLMTANLWRMRQFFMACRDIDQWLCAGATAAIVGSAPPHLPIDTPNEGKVGTVSRLLSPTGTKTKVATVRRESVRGTLDDPIVATLWRELVSPKLPPLIVAVSWSHHRLIVGSLDCPEKRYFYLAMSVREHWSERELRRQIDAALFERYTSVKRDPEKCLPDDAESGDLMPFKDHYILEFLGLEDEHSEKELRKAILANMRNFFLEFGKDLTFVGEEYPLTVGNDTFYIDLLFFHRRLQCLIAVDLKKGKFKPEHAGKSRFYCAALDEQLRLPHENPSLGLVLCRTADATQVRLALTAAAERIGIATYQTALPDEALLRHRLEQLPPLPENDE